MKRGCGPARCERFETGQKVRQGFLFLGAMREVIFLGGAIGVVMMALTQMKSNLQSTHPELSTATTSVEFEPIQSLAIDRDHQSLVVHTWKTGIEEIRLSDGYSVHQDMFVDCEAVETSETNSTSIYLNRWIDSGQMILGVRIVRDKQALIVEEFETPAQSMGDVRVSSDGSLAMVVFHHGRVVAWELASEEPVRKEYKLPIRTPSNRLSPDGNKLFVISNDGESMICDSRTGAVQLEFPNIAECCRRTAWSHDSRHLAVGNQRGVIQMFDATNGEKLWECQEQLFFSQFIKFSSDGSLLAASGCDSKIRIWNMEQPNESPGILAGSTSVVRDFVFTDSDTKLVSGCADGTIREWSIASHEMTRQIR